MIDAGGRPGLAQEPVGLGGIVRRRDAEHFQRDIAVERRVVSPIDDAHAASAKFSEHAIPAEGPADERVGRHVGKPASILAQVLAGTTSTSMLYREYRSIAAWAAAVVVRAGDGHTTTTVYSLPMRPTIVAAALVLVSIAVARPAGTPAAAAAPCVTATPACTEFVTL